MRQGYGAARNGTPVLRRSRGGRARFMISFLVADRTTRLDPMSLKGKSFCLLGVEMDGWENGDHLAS